MQSFWMLLASLMFALMGAGVKYASEHGVYLGLIILVRGLPSVILILTWALITQHSLKPKSYRLHLQRNLFGISAMWLGFFSYGVLPLATGISLNYTSSLFVGAWVIYRMKSGQRDYLRLMAVIVGFLGVVLILRPSISADQWLGVATGLLAGMSAAVAMFQVKSLGMIGEPAWRTVFYFSVVACVSSVFTLHSQDFHSFGRHTYFALALIGICGMFGQLFMTQAYGSGSQLLSAVLQYTTIIFAALLGRVLWNNIPDTLAWIGIMLVIFAGVFSAWRTLEPSKKINNK